MLSRGDRVIGRRTDVDLVRCLALASMFVAHVAPGPGPAHVLELSEYWTMPLFSMLIGVSSQLVLWGNGTVGRWTRSMAVRATVLIVLGMALDRAGAQIVIVLVHLGVLVVVAGILARFSTVVLGLLAVATFAMTLVLVAHVTAERFVYGGLAAQVAQFMWLGPYRLFFMVGYSIIGVLVARWWLHAARAGSVVRPGAVGALLLGVGAAAFGAEQLGRIDLVPDSGTVQETLVCVILAVGLMGCGLASARLLSRTRGGRRLVAVLAAVGAMTLTLYALQILWLAYDVRLLHPGQRDDSWTNLVVLLVGSAVVVWMWRSVVRAKPWRTGPVEGLTSYLIGRRS